MVQKFLFCNNFMLSQLLKFKDIFIILCFTNNDSKCKIVYSDRILSYDMSCFLSQETANASCRC